MTKDGAVTVMLLLSAHFNFSSSVGLSPLLVFALLTISQGFRSSWGLHVDGRSDGREEHGP